MLKRYLTEKVVSDINKKMVFIVGPRQVGKTTFADYIGKEYFAQSFEYLNWDNRSDRKKIINATFRGNTKLVIFDEIHKYRKWKNHIKGIFDKNKEHLKIIVTGSSRLDTFRKGGDSLLGRYYCHRLHPVTIGEIINNKTPSEPFSELSFNNDTVNLNRIFKRLYMFGGFPEMYIAQDLTELRRWHNQHIDRLIREDIRDLENIRDIGSLEILVDLLPDKVGSLLSLNSLAEDLQVSFKTVRSWMNILERFYCHFRIYPYQSTLIKSLRKEPKMYLWDWSEFNNQGKKLENIVASHLLKFCHLIYDQKGYKTSLMYLRDRQQREVDFLVVVNKQPWFCVEVKSNEESIHRSLFYFKEKLNIPYAFQVVNLPDVDFKKDGIRVINTAKFLSAL